LPGVCGLVVVAGGVAIVDATYRDAAATEPNLAPGLLALLESAYGEPVAPEDFAGYVYAVLAHPEYTARFEEELSNRQVRVPLTRDAALFQEASDFGKRLLWLHTYGERLHGKERPKGQVPRGKAKCEKAVPDTEDTYPNEYAYDESTQTLRVGSGAFRPVAPEV